MRPLVGHGPEGEYVRGFRHFARIGDRLRRHVDEGLGLNEIFHVRDSARRGGRFAYTNLPVVDLQLRHRRRQIADEDALRAKCSMDDALPMSVSDGIGDLSQHVQPLARGQGRALCRQKVIEPDGGWIWVVEQKRGAVLVFFEVRNTEDPCVIE